MLFILFTLFFSIPRCRFGRPLGEWFEAENCALLLFIWFVYFGGCVYFDCLFSLCFDCKPVCLNGLFLFFYFASFLPLARRATFWNRFERDVFEKAAILFLYIYYSFQSVSCRKWEKIIRVVHIAI